MTGLPAPIEAMRRGARGGPRAVLSAAGSRLLLVRRLVKRPDRRTGRIAGMLRWLTAGESHGPALVAMLEGLPAGVEVTTADIAASSPAAGSATAAAPG